jgi:hypothetical protein
MMMAWMGMRRLPAVQIPDSQRWLDEQATSVFMTDFHYQSVVDGFFFGCLPALYPVVILGLATVFPTWLQPWCHKY